MNAEELQESIPSFIEKAINLAKKISDGKITLTTSFDSIDDLDETVEYLHNLWAKKLIDDTVARNVSVTLGVLLGEMFVNEEGFHWTKNNQDIPVVETEDGNQLSPISKLYKIITDEDDGEGTARGFYEGFKVLEHYHSLSDDEKEKLTVYIE